MHPRILFKTLLRAIGVFCIVRGGVWLIDGAARSFLLVALDITPMPDG